MNYHLKNIPEEYKDLALNPRSILDQLGDKSAVNKILKQPATNESLLPIWKDISSSMRNVLDNDPAIPDVAIWLFVYLLLSEKAYSVLKEHIAPTGEFLPLTVDGEQMYLFNCQEFAKEDEEQCLTEYIDGLACGLKLLTFDENDTKNRLLFKSKLQGGNRLFATDRFKSICEKNDLKGLRYDEDLLGIFGEQQISTNVQFLFNTTSVLIGPTYGYKNMKPISGLAFEKISINLQDALADACEFLPLTVDVESWFSIHMLNTIDSIDREQTIYNYRSNGRINRVLRFKKLVIHKDLIASGVLCYVKNVGLQKYCSGNLNGIIRLELIST